VPEGASDGPQVFRSLLWGLSPLFLVPILWNCD